MVWDIVMGVLDFALVVDDVGGSGDSTGIIEKLLVGFCNEFGHRMDANVWRRSG
jgi:hypothetical protein